MRNSIDQKLDQYLRDKIAIERIKKAAPDQAPNLAPTEAQLRTNERLIYDAIKACWDDFIPKNSASESLCSQKAAFSTYIEINSDIFANYAPLMRPLSSFHDECNSPAKAKTSACIAAAHRYCNTIGMNVGLPQFQTAYEIGVACLRGQAIHDVSYDTLRSFHSGCHDAYSPDCIAATHRYCNSIGQGAGVGQELGEGVVGVACFTPSLYRDASHFELAQLDSGCHANDSQSLSCTKAAHRWCSQQGFEGGLIQEVGTGAFGVACTRGKLQNLSIN